jgi:Ca2+-dependent lipid-binding protein
MSKTLGNLLIEVASAVGLPGIDNGSIDPYVVIVPEGGLRFAVPEYAPAGWPRTHTHVSNRNPVWNQSFDLVVTDLGQETAAGVTFKVFDSNSFSSDKEVALVTIPFSTIRSNRQQNLLPFKLSPSPKMTVTEAGELTLKVSFLPVARADLDPREELATFEKGSYQFKTFTSNAAKSQAQDVRAVNITTRDWLNSVRGLIELIKMEQENTDLGTGLTVWFRVL